MSKPKLALLVFCIAFGLNIFAFVFSKKTFQVEEEKKVWMYELPQTASPLDAYMALDLGPHQGVIGTLFAPNYLAGEQALESFLADRYLWNDRQKVLEIELKKEIKFENGDAITPDHFIAAHDWIMSIHPNFKNVANWNAWLNATLENHEGRLRYHFTNLNSKFDLENFLSQVLTHPLTGPIHPKNLAELKAGNRVTKDWVSSGAYFVRKWTAKEIELGSRENFKMGMRDGFFRVLKYQSAPIKNPSCDFMQARAGDEKTFNEHTPFATRSELFIFWVCRSFQVDGACKNPAVRETLSQIFSGNPVAPGKLNGVKVKYRIPIGSDDFRQTIRTQLESKITLAGGQVEETSFFFKNSKDTDIELEFVTVPASAESTDFATSLAALSSRLGPQALTAPHVLGVLSHFPQNILMKHMKGEVFSKVFLEPDLDEKKLPL